MSTITIDADKIDWTLLRKQKEWLGNCRCDDIDVDGMIGLISLLQKEAAPALGERAVYGALRCHLSGDVTGCSDRFSRGTVYKYRLHLLDASTMDMIDTYEYTGTFTSFEGAAEEMVRVAELARTQIAATGRWGLLSFTLGKLVELI